jgi:mannose-1-phosphate guanylyltransferase
VFAPEIISNLRAMNKSVIDLSTELIPNLVGRLQIWSNTGYHRDIGTPESLRKANIEFDPAWVTGQPIA